MRHVALLEKRPQHHVRPLVAGAFLAVCFVPCVALMCRAIGSGWANRRSHFGHFSVFRRARWNLACIYCDRHMLMARELSREQIFTTLAEFPQLGMR